MIGCGFWAPYQVAGWREVPGVEVAALCNRTRPRAEALAGRLGVPAVYDDAEAMIAGERPDVVDVVTDVGTHPRFVKLAASRGVPVICQKPLAPTLEEAEGMVAACREAGVPLFVHENWRWQAPIRAFREALRGPGLGRVFRARIDFLSGFPVFRNQPFLRELDQFILTDIGSHVLDVARFLFGEASRLYAQTQTVHPDIRGEDVATVMMRMAGPATVPGGATVACQMAYAENHLEHDRFPETYLFAETEHGSVELGPDYWVRTTTADGTRSRRHPPPRHAWADPAYDVVQASIVPCCADLAAGLRGTSPAETTGEDNLRTVRLVFGAYESARSGRAVSLP
ncbi:putative oxidoreductase YcjS [Aquisphaera giovannonii]|uniref:Putative oxidoreductase YcjS n=1 Tax=Aquisphaera giovannonii TaxID=406548 RepID=A0A5B9W3K8_9BACT|nr:Gfo/Idh/MocA family oxidoreductase [Aquisphaera giovannonii]QEH35172.1 putative oxidoreductase YcjS [Aquisphaera giovannonii]